MTFLLDVNILLVLHDPVHRHYKGAYRWFASRGSKSFATCPLTQSSLIRVLTRGIPGVGPFEMPEARNALERIVQLPGHVFWPDTPAYLDCTNAIFVRMQGHRQTTDAYLLGLAVHNRGKLATLDYGIRHLAGNEFASSLEVIEA